MKSIEPIIFLICGKARQGKTTLSNLIASYYQEHNLKVVNTSFAKYLKYYAKEIKDYNLTDSDKYRSFLQELGNFIRIDMNKEYFLIDRLIEDINIYAHYADIIVIGDVRFKKEITHLKKHFSKVITIHITRPNFQTDLTEQEQNDISEIDLDNYTDYDYKIVNNNLENLEKETKRICIEVGNKWKK